MCDSSVNCMPGDFCNNGGDAGLDSPPEAVLIDGNFDPFWMLQALVDFRLARLALQGLVLAGVQELCPHCSGGSSGCHFHGFEASDISLFIEPAIELMNCKLHFVYSSKRSFPGLTDRAMTRICETSDRGNHFDI